MPANDFYDSTGAPSTGSSGTSSTIRSEFDAIEAGFNKFPTMTGNGGKAVFVNAGGTALEAIDAAAALTSMGAESTANKDASGGYVGLTLLKINFKNALGTVVSFFTNANTSARTYTFQNRDGTIADNTDLALKANLSGPTFTDTVTLPSTTSIGSVSSTEIAYLNNCTSEVQTQINGKAATSHSHAQSDVTDLATALSGKEASLGNPSTNGHVLSSTTGGSRSWIAAGASGPKAVQVFTSSGTYTKTSGATVAIVEVVGSGGGGAGSTTGNYGTAGSGGGYGRKYLSLAAVTTETVTIGDAGTAGTNTSDGVAGATCSFGAHLSVTGGGKGKFNAASDVGGTATGGDISVQGGRGGAPGAYNGGSSVFGFGGSFVTPSSVAAGAGYGAGGAGCSGGSPATGGAGTKGIVIVTEY
jgi:hypothetical protein